MQTARALPDKLFFIALLLILTLASLVVLAAGPQSFNPAITEFEPAAAIRAAGCITCHAKIGPGFITDFGYGEPYFFGQRVMGSAFSSFDGSVYGDFYGSGGDKTGWLTSRIEKNVVVPETGIAFDLRAAGSKLPDFYQKPLQAKSLAGYLRALEDQKPVPAAIIEKKKVFIGAPTAATLETRFDIAPGSDIQSKYFKSGRSSPDVRGIAVSAAGDFFTNTEEVVCDGDLLIRGTLFLNQMTLSTATGCRIYATGPIFVQDAITFKDPGSPVNNTNLQLVSAQAILLGIGDKSCDATYKDSPLSRRLVSGYAVSTYFTQDASRRGILPKAFGQGIYEQGKLIPALEDAGCRDETVHYSHLLLNAPQIHGRYKGSFKGLVIAEFALFRLGSSNFEFDPVFKRVPVLPRLKHTDYLEVQ